MADIQKILFEIELENGQFKVNAKEAEAAIKGIGNSSNTSSSGFANLKNGLNLASVAIKGFLGFQVAKELYNIGKASLGAAANMEQQKVAFTSMLGSAEKAQKLLDQMQTFAASTPFEFNEIVEAGKKLVAFGEDSENVTKTLGKIGDVASGLGIPLGELTEIYGKARVQQTLYAEDLNQLAGRGIPIFEELGKVMNVNASEVKKLGSEGKISFSMLEQTFTNMTSEGGKFAGLMDAQSRTLAGKWSNFNDEIDKTLLLLGDRMAPAAGEAVTMFSLLAKRMNESIEASNRLAAANPSAGMKSGFAQVNAMLDGTVDRLQAMRGTDAAINEEIQNIADGMGDASLSVDGMNAKYGEVKTAANLLFYYNQGFITLNKDQIAQMEEIVRLEQERIDKADPLIRAQKELNKLADDAKKLADDAKKAEDDKKAKAAAAAAAYKARKTDAVAYYTAIGDLEKASGTSIELEQKKQLANAKLMYQRRLITKAEYEESIKQIELNYAKQTSDAQEKIRNDAAKKEAAAMYEKFDNFQAAYEKYASFVTGISGQLGELVSMAASNEIANIENNSQKKIDAMNAEYEHQIALIDASSLSEEQKAAKKKTLDEQLARDEKAINEKAARDKKEAQIKAAKASKTLQLFDAVVSTPAAAMQAFRSINMPLQPWTFPLAIGAAASTTALGLAKIKLIADQPLPSFDVGSLNIPKDMTAKIHKGEMIIPKPFAESVRSGEATVGGGSGGINIYVQGSVIDSQGLLAIVDNAQKEKASLLGATTYTYKSAYR